MASCSLWPLSTESRRHDPFGALQGRSFCSETRPTKSVVQRKFAAMGLWPDKKRIMGHSPSPWTDLQEPFEGCLTGKYHSFPILTISCSFQSYAAFVNRELAACQAAYHRAYGLCGGLAINNVFFSCI